MSLALTDDLGSESSHCTLSKVFMVILGNVKRFLDLIELSDSNITSSFETISNLKWMKTFIEKFLSLLKNGSGQYDNTCGSITNLIILRSRKFNKKSGSLMMDFHLFEDGGTIISDDDFTVWRDEHLIHTLWSK
jgi:hypothetical protein